MSVTAQETGESCLKIRALSLPVFAHSSSSKSGPETSFFLAVLFLTFPTINISNLEFKQVSRALTSRRGEDDDVACFLLEFARLKRVKLTLLVILFQETRLNPVILFEQTNGDTLVLIFLLLFWKSLLPAAPSYLGAVDAARRGSERSGSS